jgi:hypothetical protein
MVLSIVFNITLVLLSVFYFYRKFASKSKALFFLALMLKIGAAISVGLIYTYYYPQSTDTWSYFNSACNLADLARTDLGDYLNFIFTNQHSSSDGHLLYVEDRTSLFVKFTSILCLAGGNSYWICAIYFSIISFFSSWYLYLQVCLWREPVSNAAAVSLFFLPSVIFWGSGLIKETLALAGLYYLTSIFIRFVTNGKLVAIHFLIALVALVVTWLFKYYWLAVFLVVLVPSVVVILLLRQRPCTVGRSILIWIFFFLVTCVLGSFLHPNFYASRIFLVIVENHDRYVQLSSSANLIHFYKLTPDWLGMLTNSPWAVISGLYRPFFWEATSATSWLVAIENLFIFIFTLGALMSKRNSSDWRTTFFILAYSILLCALLALSTPNFGTLSRYRVGFLPFFFFAVLWSNPLLDYLSKRISFLTKRTFN